jgi:MFS family permease
MTAASAQPLPRGLRGYSVLLRRNRDVRMLWLGQLVSYIGDWFNTVALLGLLVELTGSPAAGNLVTVAQILPSAIAGLFISGAAADRFNRKTIMIAADIARGVIALSYLFVRSPELVWLGYAATVGLSLGASFFNPASSAAMPNLTTREELPIANTLGQSTFASMLFVGALIGGVVAQVFGREVAFVLNALSFFLSAFFISQARGRFNATPDTQVVKGASALRVLGEGFLYLRENSKARAYVLVKLAWSWIFGAMGLYSVYALTIYKVGDIGTSWLFAARGLGAFISPIIVGTLIPLTQTDRLKNVIRLGLVISVIGYFVFALSGTMAVGAAGAFTGHFGGAMVWTFSILILQATTPDRLRGRVLALDGVAQSLVIAIANLIAGVIAVAVAPQAGAVAVVAIGGVGALLWIIGTWKS